MQEGLKAVGQEGLAMGVFPEDLEAMGALTGRDHTEGMKAQIGPGILEAEAHLKIVQDRMGAIAGHQEAAKGARPDMKGQEGILADKWLSLIFEMHIAIA